MEINIYGHNSDQISELYQDSDNQAINTEIKYLIKLIKWLTKS